MTNLTPTNIDEVTTKGFTVVRGAFSTDHAQDLRQRLDTLAREQEANATERSKVDSYMVHNPFLKDPAFYSVLDAPLVIDAVDQFLTDTGIVYAFTTSSMPAGGTNYSHRIHVDSPRVIPNYMTNLGIIVALDDFTDDNGATYYLPGSFEQTAQPSSEDFFRSAERVYPNRGDLVVFNARTWHLGGQNTTNQARHAITMNCCRSYMRQRFDYPRMIDPSVATKLTETQRRLLGYNVRVPASMDEYYLPEEQRLYKANQG